MLEKLFTSKSRVSLLTLLVFNQDRQYYLREIADIVGASPINISRELDNLRDLGLINVEKKGNLKLFSIDNECVLYSSIRDLLIKTEFVGAAIRQNLQDKAKYAFIYGSFAQGTESASSDIDLFVVGEISEDELIRIIQESEETVRREINYVLWAEKDFIERAKGHHLLRSIKKNKIIMLVGDEDEFRAKIR